MITKFKLFESVEHDLTEQLDNTVIDKYFDDHLLKDASEIIEEWPSFIWQFVDDDEYIKDLIRDEISSYSISDFNKDDYINYLKNNMSDDKEKVIIKLYNKLKKLNYKEEYYDYDMLYKLKEKQLREIIEDENEEEEFVTSIITERYSKKDAQEVIEEQYGQSWILDNGDKIYDMFRDYVDDSEIVDLWKKDVDKRENVENEIWQSAELQNILLDKDESNVFLLAKLFIENSDEDNISKDYYFQDMYIKTYVKENIGNKTSDRLRAEALKYLFDNFELNDDIEEEYQSDMWMIETDKFNI